MGEGCSNPGQAREFEEQQQTFELWFIILRDPALVQSSSRVQTSPSPHCCRRYCRQNDHQRGRGEACRRRTPQPPGCHARCSRGSEPQRSGSAETRRREHSVAKNRGLRCPPWLSRRQEYNSASTTVLRQVLCQGCRWEAVRGCTFICDESQSKSKPQSSSDTRQFGSHLSFTVVGTHTQV